MLRIYNLIEYEFKFSFFEQNLVILALYVLQLRQHSTSHTNFSEPRSSSSHNNPASAAVANVVAAADLATTEVATLTIAD